MELSIPNELMNKPKFQVGDIFEIDDDIYILTMTDEADINSKIKYILMRVTKIGELDYGFNGYHKSIESLMTDLECYGWNAHYSIDNFEFVLQRKGEC